jgi:hypothetical protein
MRPIAYSLIEDLYKEYFVYINHEIWFVSTLVSKI